MKYPQLVSMPSAVSDWLEEQLEARGIDAVFYTRYILRLLQHTDSVDVILPDEDELHFSQLKKELKRSNGSRKRIRRSTEWWHHGHADPEQLNRLAAVECLMSASDQTFGIESLVDELCEKLKAVNDENSPKVDPILSKKNLDIQQQQQQNCVISPQELAERYYAAFPPLTRSNNNNNNKTTNSPTKLISLVPKWIPSPIKQKKQPTTNTNNTNHRRNNKEDKIVKMKTRSTIVGNKQRFNNYFTRNNDNNSNKKEYGKNMIKSVEGMNHWDLSLFINNNKNNSKFGNIINGWPKNIVTTTTPSTSSVTINNEHCLNNEWNIEDDLNMYEDLPVDISDLLDDSPSTVQHDETVELMNIANMRDTGKRGFIQCGTNITTSIWSNDDITSEFGSISINTNDWIITNNNNNNIDDCDDNIEASMFFEENWDYTLPEKWSDDNTNNPITLSLIKLNHNKETSPFVEVCPKPKSQQYNPFRPPPSPPQTSTTPQPPSPTTITTHNSPGALQNTTPIRTIEIDSTTTDDLLTSTISHFRPIKESINNHNNNNNNSQQQCEYSNGTTFTISRNFDQINYKRTKSGGLYLENDYAMKRKYYEYTNHNSNSNLTTIPTTQHQQQDATQTKNYGFILKFIVCQNDKECQTDELDFIMGVTRIQEIIPNNNYDNKESYHIKDNNNINKSGTIVPFKCTCLPNQKAQQAMITNYSLGFIVCPLHPQQFNNNNNNKLMAEVIWKKQDNNINNNNNKEGKVCEKCTKSVMWNTECLLTFDCNDDGGKWDDSSLRSIWSGGEVCYSCLGRPPSTLQQTKLREDISQDGDQLLSDLSTIQKTYMESNDLTLTTIATPLQTIYDINELLITRDRKRRRHSLIMAINNNNNNNNNNDNININNNNDGECGIWSFASRLEEDCLIQMSTIPTLRSVTL